MELIDREALLEDIEEISNSPLNEWSTMGVLNIVYKQPSVNQWIPCSERLPEEDGEYLIWYDCGYGTDNPSDDDEKGYMIMNFDVGMNSFGFWYDQYDHYTLGFLDSEFIYCETAVAWMPLPELYKGE